MYLIGVASVSVAAPELWARLQAAAAGFQARREWAVRGSAGKLTGDPFGALLGSLRRRFNEGLGAGKGLGVGGF